MVTITHKTQVTGQNNPDHQVSKNVWNEEHDIVGLSISDVEGLQDELDALAENTSGAAWGGITGDISSQTDLQSAFTQKADTSHTHDIGDVDGLQSALDGKQASGSYAAATHGHAIADVDGLQSELDGKQEAGSYAAGTHSHGISDVTDLQSALDAKHTAGEALVFTEGAPSAPASGEVTIFRREIAGRQFPAFMGPSGLDSALQPFLARNKVGYWCPPGNATTAPGVFGFTAPTVTGFTATARNIATTNIFTRMRRLGYVTAATVGAVGQWRINAYQFTLGSASTGLGGFTYVMRFGISDAAAVSGARMFIGMRSSFTPSNVEPSTLTNCIGVGHGAADANLKIFHGGSSAQTPIDLGANFPITHGSVEPYELALFSPPNSGDVSYQVTRLSTGDTATGTITNSGATVLPTNTTLMAPWGYRTNNATALAVGLDVMSAYIETDY